MKKIFAVLGLTVCAFAADSQAQRPTLLPYCWNVDGTSCTSIGATQRCTDGIYTDYVCTCRYNSYTRVRYWDCPEVR